jgi:hypothetical protein
MEAHRKIWIEHHGPIPKDRNGRSYEIHHINGDHSDNRIENMICVSIEDHFKIHEAQDDIMACCAILRRMKEWKEWTPEQQAQLSEQAKSAAEKRVVNGTHNFLGGKIQKEHQQRRKEEGTHNFVGKSNPNYKVLPDGSVEIMLTCLDKDGNKVRVTKTEYSKQVGDPRCWDYVLFNSKEGKKRKEIT